jgi:DNA polymerase III subunit gamma/tau
MSEQLSVESWALRYRPRKFADLVGQEHAVALMRAKLKQSKLPPFALIVGPSGCGKTTMARMLARYANCEKRIACGKCASCLHDPDKHPDVLELNAATDRGIDDVRKLIQQARFKPRYNLRMIIIDEAHQLTPQAQQAFLKPLEEPPSTTMYVICTTDPEKLPEAMLTRASPLKVRFPKAEEMIARMRVVLEAEGVKMKDDLLKGVVEYSGGSARRALNLLEDAATLIVDNPKADPSKILVQIGAAAEPASAAVAMRIVIAMHKGIIKGLVKALYDAEDPVPTINLALRYNEFAMAKMAFGDVHHPQVWATADNRLFHAGFLKHVEKPSLLTAAKVQKRLVGVRADLVTVSMGARSLLLGKLVETEAE